MLVPAASGKWLCKDVIVENMLESVIGRCVGGLYEGCWYQARPPAMGGGCVSMDESNRGVWRARNKSMSRYRRVVVRPVMIRVDEMPTRNTDLKRGRRPLLCAVVTTCQCHA